MPLVIEQLDDHLLKKTDVVIIGESLLIKFTPSKSLMESSDALKDIIDRSDLLEGSNLKNINDLRRISSSITKDVESAISVRDMLSPKKMNASQAQVDGVMVYFLEMKKRIMAQSESINTIRVAEKIKVADAQNLYFCNTCSAYIGNNLFSLPDNCHYCGTTTTGTDPTYIHVLSRTESKYLGGEWFEDYIAKLYKTAGWETWCHGEVMGSSGMKHPVDILAVHRGTGRVVVGECKTGKMGKIAPGFVFAARFFDVKSTDGIFFSLRGYENPQISEYMKRTPGLQLWDSLEGISDETLLRRIDSIISSIEPEGDAASDDVMVL